METAWSNSDLFPGIQTGDERHPFQDSLWNPENKEKTGENEKILFGDNWQNLVN